MGRERDRKKDQDRWRFCGGGGLLQGSFIEAGVGLVKGQPLPLVRGPLPLVRGSLPLQRKTPNLKTYLCSAKYISLDGVPFMKFRLENTTTLEPLT